MLCEHIEKLGDKPASAPPPKNNKDSSYELKEQISAAERVEFLTKSGVTLPQAPTHSLGVCITATIIIVTITIITVAIVVRQGGSRTCRGRNGCSC